MHRISLEKAKELEDNAFQIRKLVLETVTRAGWGHPGGSFSLAEILSALYFDALRIKPERPDWEARDYVVLSKAHCSPALYAALALRGVLPRRDLDTYCTADGLEGHLDMRTPGVESCGGSLGLGLSYSAGIAYGLKQRRQYAQRVYCILGDGEMNEGQNWEAIMFSAHYQLFNLIAILDHNQVMAKGFVDSMMAIEPVTEKLKAFGWNVIEADGHDVAELTQAYHRAKYMLSGQRPTCIVAHTVKGKGVEECEFNCRWHTHAPSEAEARRFFDEMKTRYGKPKETLRDAGGVREEDGLESLFRGDGE